MSLSGDPRKWLPIAGSRGGTALAHIGAIRASVVAGEVDTLAAFGADDASGLVAREVFRANVHAHPLVGEELVIGEFAIGCHLLAVLVRDLRMKRASGVFGGFERDDPDRASASQVAKSGGHLAEVEELEGAFAGAAPG